MLEISYKKRRTMYLYMHHLRIPEAKVVRVHHYHMYYKTTICIFHAHVHVHCSSHFILQHPHGTREEKNHNFELHCYFGLTLISGKIGIIHWIK